MNSTEKGQHGPSRFAPGFQLSVLDVIVLIAGAWGTWFMGREIWWAGAMIGFVVGHFFLFCNVFRISRASELIWAAGVVILGGATIATGFPGWPATFAASLLLTVVLVVFAMRQPSYHGVLLAARESEPPDVVGSEQNRSNANLSSLKEGSRPKSQTGAERKRAR